MGKSLSTSGVDNKPLVNVKGAKGSFFEGILEGHRQVDSSYQNEDGTKKKFDLYDFSVTDTDMELQKKVGKEYISADVEAGGSVTVFAPTRLNNALKQASIGDTLRIVYQGLGKATKFGAKPHDYTVEVL